MRDFDDLGDSSGGYPEDDRGDPTGGKAEDDLGDPSCGWPGVDILGDPSNNLAAS